MKKLFIGLLIAAAGAVIFFLLQNKDKTITANNFRKEQIIGKWKLDSLWSLKDFNTHFTKGLFDPKLKNYHYEFKKDGYIFQFIDDTLIKDKSRYEWTNENQLAWKESLADAPVEVFDISLLDKDSMKLQSKDSSVILFTKVK